MLKDNVKQSLAMFAIIYKIQRAENILAAIKDNRNV
jgi:hypothetical protein